MTSMLVYGVAHRNCANVSNAQDTGVIPIASTRAQTHIAAAGSRAEEFVGQVAYMPRST